MKKLVLPALFAFAIVLFSGCGGLPPNTLLSLDDFYTRGMVVGVLSGSASVHFVAEPSTVREFSTGEELMNNLKSGALDCVVMEKSTAEPLVSRTSGVKFFSEPLLEYDPGFAVAKENAELVNVINSALAELQENGTITGLHNKYFAGKSFKYTPAPHEDVTASAGTLTLAAPPDFPPYSYIGIDGELTGMGLEAAGAVCDILGVELLITESAAQEIIAMVQLGKADFALGWIPGENAELVAFSDGYARSVQSIVVRK